MPFTSRIKYSTIRLAYIIIDLICIHFGILLASKIRHTTLPFDVTLQSILFDPKNPFQFIFALWMVTTVLMLNVKDLYQTHREMFEAYETALVVKSTIYASMIVIIALYILKVEGFPRTVLMIGTFFNLLSLSFWRFLKRIFVHYLVIHGYNNFNALIIGTGKVGRALALEINKHPQLGIKIVGFLTDLHKVDEEITDDLKVLGPISDLTRIARQEFINKIFITDYHDNRTFLRLLQRSKELGLAIRVIPHGFELMPGDFTKYNIGYIPVLEYCDAKQYRKQAGKRIFDFIFSSILFLLFFPFLLAMMILIKWDSPGPVFYLSKRYGRGGKMFNMFKFRSMVQDADRALDHMKDLNEVDGPIFKIKKDPRVTRVGRFLRKYSIDELPQLINVIKGDMSLVGPRPLPIAQVEKEDFQQLRRLEVRPGITGLWQIRGRSNISFKRLVRWDIWYINNWSFWLDINILWQTIPVVLSGTGAY
jgi:exopolysaccharide biosynthesis polyprenyl glycosylphosphotransferase